MNLQAKRILAVGAHPDDVEFICSGTLALLRRLGAELHVATLTVGDCGSAEESANEISRTRRKEAADACALLGATYHPLDFEDVSIFYDERSIRRVTGLVRRVDPWMVFTHPHEDYMIDHEMTSRLVRTACFVAPIPNYRTPGGESDPASGVPYLFYAHPMEGTGITGAPIAPHFYVDVTEVLSVKESLLACHASQRNWLRSHHGIDEYLDSLRRWDAVRGEAASRIAGRPVSFAEAFLQHRGHAYPADNPLIDLLGSNVIVRGM